MENGEDKIGKYFKVGMIERLALTLDNYASSDWGKRFYSEDFLAGFCARRNETHALVSKATGALLILTTMLAFLDSVEGTTTFWGITFSIPKVGALALSVMIGSSFVTFVSAMIDQLIIDKFLYTLGSRIGAYKFELVVLNHTSRNLWTTAIVPTFHGLKSGAGHSRIQYFMISIYAILGVAFAAYPTSVVLFTFADQLSDGATPLKIILMCVTTLLFLFAFFLVFVFSFSYKFRPADFSEPAAPYIPEDFLEMGHPIQPDPQDGSNSEDRVDP